MLDRVGRHWGWALAFGIITVLVGVLVLVWPGRTLIVVAVLFGIQLVVMGIFRFASAFGSQLSAGTRVLFALLGVLSLIVGLYALRHVLITLLALALLLGIFWIVSGAVELFNALSTARCTAAAGPLPRAFSASWPASWCWSIPHLAVRAGARAQHLAPGVRHHGDRDGVPDPVSARLTRITPPLLPLPPTARGPGRPRRGGDGPSRLDP